MSAIPGFTGMASSGVTSTGDFTVGGGSKQAWLWPVVIGVAVAVVGIIGVMFLSGKGK